MELRRLLSRRSVIASLGALVAHIAFPGSGRVEAAESAVPPLSAASPEAAAPADAIGKVTYYVFDCEGRLVSERVEYTFKSH